MQQAVGSIITDPHISDDVCIAKTSEDKVRSDAGSSTGEDIKQELYAATDEQNSDGPPAEKKPCIGEID